MIERGINQAFSVTPQTKHSQPPERWTLKLSGLGELNEEIIPLKQTFNSINHMCLESDDFATIKQFV